MISDIFSAIRPRHWIKNALIFIPLIFAKKLFTWPDNFLVAWGFVIYCLATSATYLFNDIADAKNDRYHPTKRNRAIAQGRITPADARRIARLLALAALLFSGMLDKTFFLIIVFCLLLNHYYTYRLKKFVVLDIACIAILFLARMFSGAVIANVEVSWWIVSMTVLLALLLGLNKRRQECRLLKDTAILHRPVLACYRPFALNSAIAMTTFLIFAVYFLYAISLRTQMKFGTTHLILTVPLIYGGVWRYLYLTCQQQAPEDPTDILFSDLVLKIIVAGWVLTCILIIYPAA